MRHTISIAIGITFIMMISCNGNKTYNSRKFAVEVTSWGFSGPSFEAFLYNTDISTYSLHRRSSKTILEENTLYILVHDSKEGSETTDSLKILLSGEQVDSLYTLAYKYLSEFEINNEIEEGKIYETILDGSNISVALNYDGKLMQCSQYRLKSIIKASEQGASLVTFINKKVPNAFKLY